MEKMLPTDFISLLNNHGVKLSGEEAKLITEFIGNLIELSQKIDEQTILLKPVINFEEACRYLRLSPSHLYKLTSQKQIPHYCPQGKKLYFSREEIDKWLLRNRKSAEEEIDEAATNYIIRNRRDKK